MSLEEKTSSPDNKASPNASLSQDKVPGRTIGVATMVSLILFVALWMNWQSSQQEQQSFAAAEFLDSLSSRFSSDNWYLPDDELLGFVEIPAGSFTMGSNPALDRMAYENERWSSSRRQGVVDLPTYYIGRFEVTVAQYLLYLKATEQSPRTELLRAQADHPVAGLSWPETLAYARWLEQQLRQSSQTPQALTTALGEDFSLNLPSEAEWEKAARGSDNRIFPWGSQPRTDLANFGASGTVSVGSIICADCSYGLADMSGNVWELTRSPLQDYPYDPSDDAGNLSDDALWVMRGGAFSDDINNVRSAVRGAVDPGVRNNTIGFRLVISSL